MKPSVALSLLVCCLLVGAVSAATDSEVDLSSFPTYLSEKLNVAVFAGRILASCIFLMIFLLPTIIVVAWASHGEGLAVAVVSCVVGLPILGFTVALGWFPIWLFIILSIIIAFLFAQKMMRATTGGD